MNTEIIAGLVTTVAGIVGTAHKAFHFIGEGQLGVKTRFGKVVRDRTGTPKVYYPGFAWVIPFVEELYGHQVRAQVVQLPTQEVMLKSGLSFHVGAVVNYRITDVYKALYEVSQVDKSIKEVAAASIRKVLADFEHPAILEDPSIVSQQLAFALQETVTNWGVAVTGFNLSEFTPTTESAQLLMAQTGVQMKVEALAKVAAQVNDMIPTNNGGSASVLAALIGTPVSTGIAS